LPKGRKELRSRDKIDILNKILDFYKNGATDSKHLDNLTFEKLFDEWLEYKRTITESPNTIKRHLQHYNKYLKGFGIKGIRYFDYLSLRALCNSIVKENNMTSKEWVNVKTIIKGMFTYAYEKGYIDSNPMDRVRISVKFRQENKKTGKTETFNSFEYKQLMAYLDEKISENSHPGFFAIKLNFFLGLRVGELVALKWSDIEDGNIHVVREENRDQNTNRICVVEHTKTHTDRFVPLIPDALAIIYKLYRRTNPDIDDYMFVKDGKRVTCRQINYLLEKYARDKNISVKSSHKIRKTFASRLDASGVPIDEIRNLLGHSNLETTMRYLYNPLTAEETKKLVQDALSSNYPHN
jgi:integrase